MSVIFSFSQDDRFLNGLEDGMDSALNGEIPDPDILFNYDDADEYCDGYRRGYWSIKGN